MSCIFCKIVSGDIPADIIYKDDKVMAFCDIEPQAPHHVLLIPMEHISSLMELNEEHSELMGYMMTRIPVIVEKAGMDKEGTRVVINCGEIAGQSVSHIHFHLFSGRTFAWPPG